MSALVTESGYFWWHTEEVPKGKHLPQWHSFGTLSISEDGLASLELTDNKLERRNRGSDQHTIAAGDSGNKYLIGKSIQGYLKDSNRYILMNNLYANGDQSFIANNSVIKPSSGFSAGDIPRYNRMRIRLAGLESWIGLGSIQADINDTEAQFRYSKPENRVFSISQGKLSFEYGFSGRRHGEKFDRLHKIIFAETVDLIFEPVREMDINNIIENHRVFESLFSLFCSEVLSLEWPSIAVNDSGQFSKLYFNTYKRLKTKINPRECAVLFENIKDKMGEISSTWLTKREIFGAGFYLFFAASREENIFTEHKFVTLIWGLEAFDRKKFPEDQKIHGNAEKLKRVLTTISEEGDKKWLKGYKKLLTQPNLETRLLRVLQSLCLFQDNKKLRIFAESCAKLRNEISHFGTNKGDGDGNSTDDLNKKCTALLYLFRALILKEIGVDNSLLRVWLFEGSRAFLIKRAFNDVGLGD